MTDVTASTKKLKVLFALIGSLGDCLPFLALAKALSNPQGGFHQWDVVVSAHPEFEDLVATKHGFTFAPISQSMVRMLKDTPEGLALRNVGMFNAVAVAKNFFTPLLRTWAEDVKAAHDLHKPDLVVLATFPAMCCLGSIGSTPYLIIHTVPAYPTSEFAPPTMNAGFTMWPRFLNTMFWNLGMAAQASMMPVIDAAHPLPFYEVNDKKIEHLYIFSPALIPKPADWPAWHHVTGSLTFESKYLKATTEAASFTAPKEIDDLLQYADQKPVPKRVVYFGLGSMLATMFESEEATALLQSCSSALEKLARNYPVVVVFHVTGLPDGCVLPKVDVAVSKSFITYSGFIPHAWLFNKCSLIVTHGGAGSVHAALQYALPADQPDRAEAASIVVLPCSAQSDQPMWGDLINRHGVGPLPLLCKNSDFTGSLFYDRLVEALAGPDAASMRKKAAQLSRALNAEDGVYTAVKHIEALAQKEGLLDRQVEQ